MKLHSKKMKKGFTILETLVAIAILTLALTGPLVIISQALKASFYSRNQITAFYLAQEAVEYIRNLRDTTSLDPNVSAVDWLKDVVTVNCAARGTCVNDFKRPLVYKANLTRVGGDYVFNSCDTAGCAPLVYSDDVSGNVPYGGSGTENSTFTRTIWLTTVPGDGWTGDAVTGAPDREVIVHVEIKWRQGATENQFVLEDHLLNWKLEK